MQKIKGNKMKSFKQFLNEKYINSSIKEWEAAVRGYIPLSAWVLKDNEMEVPKTFRVASLKSLKSLFKYQHQKKQIPTFTKGSVGISVGAIMEAEVLVELKGKTVIKFNNDADTVVDRNGNRWVKGDLTPEINSISKYMLREIDKYLQKNHRVFYGYYEFSSDPSENSEIYHKLIENSLIGKERRDFIKWYFKMAKKFMDKETIHKIMKNEEYGDMMFYNDEILLHDYEVVHWWFYEGEDYKRYGIDEFTMIEVSEFNDFSQSYKDYIEKNIFDKFTKWKSDLAKKYPGLCSNYITEEDVIKINVEKNKYPKCENINK
jgi:hypothetical protein